MTTQPENYLDDFKALTSEEELALQMQQLPPELHEYEKHIQGTIKTLVEKLPKDVEVTSVITEKFLPALLRKTLTNYDDESAETNLVEGLEKLFPETIESHEKLSLEIEGLSTQLTEDYTAEEKRDLQTEIEQLEERLGEPPELNDDMMMFASNVLEERDFLLELINDEVTEAVKKKRAESVSTQEQELKKTGSEKKSARHVKKRSSQKRRGQKKQHEAPSAEAAQEVYEKEQARLAKIATEAAEKLKQEKSEDVITTTDSEPVKPTIGSLVATKNETEAATPEKATQEKTVNELTIGDNTYTIKETSDNQIILTGASGDTRRITKKKFDALVELTMEPKPLHKDDQAELQKILTSIGGGDVTLNLKKTEKKTGAEIKKAPTESPVLYYSNDALATIQTKLKESPDDKKALLRLGIAYFANN